MRGVPGADSIDDVRGRPKGRAERVRLVDRMGAQAEQVPDLLLSRFTRHAELRGAASCPDSGRVAGRRAA
jgi:hypothetical protein